MCTPQQLVTELDPAGAGNWQGAYSNTSRTRWYVPEAKAAEGREDTVLHEFDGNRVPLGTMRLQAEAGTKLHLTGMGVEDDGTLWFDRHNAAGVSDIVTVPYVRGTVALASQAKPVKLNLPGMVQVGLSPTKTRLVGRRIQGSSEKGTDTFTRRATADVRNGVDRIFGVPVVVERRPDRVVQGFGMTDYELYVCTGLSPYPPRIEHYSMRTGELMCITPAEQYGVLASDRLLWTWHELEGMQGDLVGVKLGTGVSRRLRVVRHRCACLAVA